MEAVRRLKEKTFTVMGTCQSYVQVRPGDGCWALADRCKISQQDLTRFNAAPNFCNTLLPDQYVCCSEGIPPDFSPKPGTNGDCYTYTVQAGDYCASIATANKIGWTKIDGYNKQSWGWQGCENLQIGQKICLSTGNPPFPASVSVAVCGPQKPGTVKPTTGTSEDWAGLNQCPLKACCNQWGQCGVTPEFCTDTRAPGSAPGTAAKGTNGCFSNCGLNIKQTPRTQSPMRIGYFESWNLDRECLNMDISKMTEGNYYTHVHFGFGDIIPDWQIDVSKYRSQYEGLKRLRGIKRPATYEIFRNGVKDGNRQILARNVVKFILDEGLDGVDFDWEYPGAQDIPGIPPDSPDSGRNYAAFLRLVRNQLPREKSVSIAIPASHWYLRGFDPVTQFEDAVDYYVYMTYDLHGQWDHGNKWASEGCTAGNCLRSHVNATETVYALAMITKAGIPSNKIMVGQALYGRSFGMDDPNCSGPGCTFGGRESTATPGRCTKTAGYISNYEIRELIAKGGVRQYEEGGDVLIYNGNQWVSWLTPRSYDGRRGYYDALSFGGTADWAVDLNATYGPSGLEEAGDTEDEEDWGPTFPLPLDAYSDLGALEAALGGISIHCHPQVTLRTMLRMLDDAYRSYNDVNNGYDRLFEVYVDYIHDLIPSILNNAFMLDAKSLADFPGRIIPDMGPGMHAFDCKYSSSGPWSFCGATWDALHDGQRDSVALIAAELASEGQEDLPTSRVAPASRAHVRWSNGTRSNTTDIALPEHAEDPDLISLMVEDEVTYNFRLRDTRIWTDELAKHGLLEDWVTIGTHSFRRQAGVRPPVYRTYIFTDWPVKNASMTITNPKDIVAKAIPNIDGLRVEMAATLLELMAGNWPNGDTMDTVQAYAPSIFLLQSATDSMAQAKRTAEEAEKAAEEEERKRKQNLILLIVSVVLMFVPIIGTKVAAALGFATLARTIAITGELANLGLATYETVQSSENALINMLGMLLGLGAIPKVTRNGPGLSPVANWRKAMDSKTITSMGRMYSDNDRLLQTAATRICRMRG
ncbi:hypothetical protein KVT40_008114 [Elsinoe batatas]|uniref:chitinase n=1 Tax=Elsinoe batatas TaxID=2601811 RepID=A0A8K0KZM3_9PEZI|nr:hypothetical protein KVT40_008114 [Elsinoe batatas]